ncbi:DUF2752 domain-containing protein [Hyunsoonleella rubra]|uniref:DUF2752 domain-containing protein n=1 Tax=Hyunsoonleella rubra TaxID=1737062 RepID=A0ABW5TEE7_9FLAO
MSNIESYMLPCLNKHLFGVECMGCGLQRSFFLLIKGDFVAAFQMYPAIYALTSLFIIVGVNSFWPIKYSHKIITALAILSVATIIGSYLIKILT